MEDSSQPVVSGLEGLSADELRQLGYRVIDLVVDHRTDLRDKPVHRQRSRKSLDAALPQGLPREGTNPEAVLELVATEILTSIAHTDHPRFFGYIPSPSNYISVLADSLVSGFNIFAGHWIAGSSAGAVEATTLKWLAEIMGFPASAGGVFLSGGSMANLSAIHAARSSVIEAGAGHDSRLTLYATGQAHSSISKACQILGFAADQQRSIPVLPDQTMDCGALEAAIAEDVTAGRRPLLVAATAGTTNTGAVDCLHRIRQICDRHQAWMHVDGAYGAAGRVCRELHETLDGIQLADSLTLDPHKWWFQPFEIGCLLLRDGSLLKNAFSVQAEYLRESHAAANTGSGDPSRTLEGEINFYEYGPQLTRSFRALKLWMFMLTQGVDRIGEMILQGVTAAEQAEQLLRESPSFSVVTPASLGIVTFAPSNPALRGKTPIHFAVKALLADGHALIMTTELQDQTVFRFCPIHPDTTLEDMRSSLDRLADYLDRFDPSDDG
ncbi:MAG: aminotransferase class V-fold PLP-dependent enzyme [Pseudomonadota bacterium]